MLYLGSKLEIHVLLLFLAAIQISTQILSLVPLIKKNSTRKNLQLLQPILSDEYPPPAEHLSMKVRDYWCDDEGWDWETLDTLLPQDWCSNLEAIFVSPKDKGLMPLLGNLTQEVPEKLRVFMRDVVS